MNTKIRLAPDSVEGGDGRQRGQEIDGIRVSREEYDALVLAKSELERAKHAESIAKRTVDERVEQLEQKYRAATVKGALGDVLGGLPFITDEARRDITALMANEVEAREVDGEIVAFHRPSNQPLSELGRGELTRRFAYAIRAESGGRGAGSTQRQEPNRSGGDAGSKSPGHQLIELASQARKDMGDNAPLGGFGRNR